MAANPIAETSTTAGEVFEGIAAYIRMAEVALGRARKERNDGQIDRWQGYLHVMVGADVTLSGERGYPVALRCARYTRCQGYALEYSRPRTWAEVMERQGKRHAIRQLGDLCAASPERRGRA